MRLKVRRGMPFKNVLLGSTILGFLAGALAGSGAAAYISSIYLTERDNLGAAESVFNNVYILDQIGEGTLDQFYSSEESQLERNIFGLSRFQDDPSCLSREKARRVLAEASRYRLKYPDKEKESDSELGRQRKKKVEKILADALLKAEPRQPAP
jgi:hypothetical protein